MDPVAYNIDQLIYQPKVRKLLVCCLSLSFVFLFQVFFNVKDFNILYIISKIVFGVLSCFVFAIYFIKVIVTKQLPEYSWYLVFMFLIMMILSATTSYIFFNQPFLMGILAQVKLTGLFYYFMMLAILRGFKVTIKELEATYLLTGLVFLFVYDAANIFLNPAKYWTKASTIVVHDSKGYRFRLPDVFVSILTFYSFRKMLTNGKFVMIILFLLGYAYVLFFSHERAYLLCVTAVIAFTIFYRSNMGVKIALVLLGFVTLAWLATGGFELIADNVDTASLQTRLVTSTIAYNFVSAEFNHFIFGGGNINELWLNGFARLYGDSFYLSDIGWVGINYEFGFIGVLLCLSLYITLFVELNLGLKKHKSLLIYTLRDYVFMRFLLSILSPAIPYFVGIFTCILAICVYTRLHLKTIWT